MNENYSPVIGHLTSKGIAKPLELPTLILRSLVGIPRSAKNTLLCTYVWHSPWFLVLIRARDWDKKRLIA